jgi:hypothetical protein
MATLLDISLLSNFKNIFVWLFVFAVVFGILELAHPFGEKKSPLHAIVALIVAILMLFSENALKLLNYMVPWFIILIIGIFFVIFLVKMFGMKDQELSEIIKLPRVYVVIIIIVVVIFLIGFAMLYGQRLLQRENVATGGELGESGDLQENTEGTQGSTSSGSFQENMYSTIFHPKVLGMIVILLVAVFAMVFLTRNSG